MQPSQQKSVVLDANVLINLMDMNQLHLLSELKTFKFWIPNHVYEEVHRRHERLRLRKALKAAWMEKFEITDIPEMELYFQYRRRFGEGESACLAVSVTRGWVVASDERAVKREILNRLGAGNSLDTKGLLSGAVNQGLMSASKFEELCRRFGLQ